MAPIVALTPHLPTTPLPMIVLDTRYLPHLAIILPNLVAPVTPVRTVPVRLVHRHTGTYPVPQYLMDLKMSQDYRAVVAVVVAQ